MKNYFIFYMAVIFLMPEALRAVSLQEWERLAVKNHLSYQVAQKELKSQRASEREKLRVLFPIVAFKAEQTLGKAVQSLGTPNFEERSYRGEYGYALIDFGKSYHDYQAEKNIRKAAELKLVKIKNDLIFNLRQSYWNVVKAKKKLAIYEQALKELQQDLSKAKQLLSKKTISAYVYVEVETELQKVSLKQQSTQTELELYLWEWAQSLWLDEVPKDQPQADEKPYKLEDIQLKECLQAAQTHPDLLIAGYERESAQHRKKLADAGRWPLLHVSGSYGKSAAAFESEPLIYRDDWQAGAKLTLFFGGSSLENNANAQRTSQKLGQSNRTDVYNYGSTVSFLDKLSVYSQRYHADFEYHKKILEEEELRFNTLANVRKKYIAWFQAKTQLQISKNELALALLQVSRSKIQSSHRSISFAEQIKAKSAAYEKEAAAQEAVAEYAVALAALAQATGNSNQFPIPKEPG